MSRVREMFDSEGKKKIHCILPKPFGSRRQAKSHLVECVGGVLPSELADESWEKSVEFFLFCSV